MRYIFIYTWDCFILGGIVVVRDYSWYCALCSGIISGDTKKILSVPGVKPGLATCKASITTSLLSGKPDWMVIIY